MSAQIVLRDEDGVTVWDLLNGPVQLEPGGLKGLHFPPVQVYSRESPARPGRRVTGSRALARPVSLPLNVGVENLTVAQFRAAEAGFYRTVRPGRKPRLEVTIEGETRTLVVEVDEDGAQDFETDPFEEFAGVVLPYPALLEMMANDPYWLGPLTTYDFEVPTDSFPTFPENEDTDDYVLFLGSANTTSERTVNNPGDFDAWPTYVFTGPLNSFSATIGTGKISGSFFIPDGATLTVNTDPLVQTAVLSTAPGSGNVTNQLDTVGFRPIPKGTSVPINVVLNGEGKLRAFIQPTYLRAWG